MKILATDPGGTIGFSSNLLTPNQWQLKFSTRLDLYNYLIQIISKHDTIVCESFDRRLKEHVQEIAIKDIAIIELVCQENNNIPLHMQTPSYGKAFFDNKKLEHLGLFEPGAAHSHSMDALRHRLQFEKQQGLFDLFSLKGL